MSASTRRIRNVAHHVLASQAADENADTTTKTDVATGSHNRGQAHLIPGMIKSGKLRDAATLADGSKVSDVLPGPLQDRPREELLVEIAQAEAAGSNHSQVRKAPRNWANNFSLL